jgi:hypothetical protein
MKIQAGSLAPPRALFLKKISELYFFFSLSRFVASLLGGLVVKKNMR